MVSLARGEPLVRERSVAREKPDAATGIDCKIAGEVRGQQAVKTECGDSECGHHEGQKVDCQNGGKKKIGSLLCAEKNSW